jgi:hypothetical protein
VVSKPSKELKYIDQAFIAHKWIEPSETIDDVKLIQVPAGDAVAMQLELEVFGIMQWSSSTAFPLNSVASPPIFDSEDEQDEIDPAKEALAHIETGLIRARAISAPQGGRVELELFIRQAESLRSQLISTASPESLLEEAFNLVRDFDKHFG